MELTKETVNCFKKVHLNFLYYSVLENSALATSNGVGDCGRGIAHSEERSTAKLFSMSFFQYCLGAGLGTINW